MAGGSNVSACGSRGRNVTHASRPTSRVDQKARGSGRLEAHVPGMKQCRQCPCSHMLAGNKAGKCFSVGTGEIKGAGEKDFAGKKFPSAMSP